MNVMNVACRDKDVLVHRTRELTHVVLDLNGNLCYCYSNGCPYPPVIGVLDGQPGPSRNGELLISCAGCRSVWSACSQGNAKSPTHDEEPEVCGQQAWPQRPRLHYGKVSVIVVA